ncbi:trypsin-1-like protein, partial [Leptotrombidium deliense]
CGKERVSSRIFGGQRVPDGKYPWMALLNLILPNGETARCGGSLINDRYILTAAHCLPHGLRQITVTLGINKATEDRERRKVKFYTKHTMYNSKTTENDIALVQLAEPVQFTPKIQPICLPPQDMLKFGPLVIAGWGSTNRNGSGVSQYLLEATIREYDFDECNSEMGHQLNRNSQFCAGEVGKNSCSGDSGGPVMSYAHGRYHVVGLISYRLGKCGDSRKSVRTRVSYFLDWIKRNTPDANYCRL